METHAHSEHIGRHEVLVSLSSAILKGQDFPVDGARKQPRRMDGAVSIELHETINLKNSGTRADEKLHKDNE